jgi:hypothetical protein
MASRRMRTGRATLAVGIVVATALTAGLAACGDGGGGGGGSASPTRSPSATATGPPSTRSPSGSPSATAEQQVRQNWEKFFSPTTPLPQKVSLLENGQRLQPLLTAFSGDPRVGQVTAKVQSVTLTSVTTAHVRYSLSLRGSVVLPSASGTSVLQDKVWKVSDESLCALINLNNTSGAAIPGC